MKGGNSNEKDRSYSYFPGYPVYPPVSVRLTSSDILTPGGVGMTGQRLQELRINKCITQRELAEMLGYKGRGGENTVQKWEYGVRPIPIKHWRKLAKILDVKLEEFIPE